MGLASYSRSARHAQTLVKVEVVFQIEGILCPLEADQLCGCFAPLGQQVVTLRGLRRSGKCGLHPGRVERVTTEIELFAVGGNPVIDA